LLLLCVLKAELRKCEDEQRRQKEEEQKRVEEEEKERQAEEMRKEIERQKQKELADLLKTVSMDLKVNAVFLVNTILTALLLDFVGL
jgi:hypothetical protein